MTLFRRTGGAGPGPLVAASPGRVRRDRARRAVLEAYDLLLEGCEAHQVVVLAAPAPAAVELGDAFARARPGARVLVLVGGLATLPAKLPAVDERVTVRACPDVHRAHAALLVVPAPQVLVDGGGSPASLRAAAFNHLFPALAEGGRYLLLDGGRVDDPALQDREGETVPQLLDRLLGTDPARPVVTTDDQERVGMLGEHAWSGRVLALTKRRRTVAKVRERDVDAVLPARLGPGRLETLEARPATTFRSRSALTSNRPELDLNLLPVFEVPPRTLRVYRDVVCAPRQVALADDLLLPASFHHPLKRRLRNRGLVDAARWYARFAEDPLDVQALPGTWYHLASEFPGHFGHVMTEDLSRLWGWDRAKRAYPDLKLLVGAGDRRPPAFWSALLEAYGIEPDDVVAAPTAVRVERLVTATPQLHNGRYVDPDVEATWTRVCEGLAGQGEGPRRIFVTRPDGLPRRCLNGAELEARFVAAGFVVVSPESLTMADQVALFAGAATVAGYAGSGLFTAVATAHGADLVVVASDSYTATNEWLISSVKGFRHHQLWCPSARAHEGHFDARAFHADFTFDLRRDGDALDRVLDACAS